MRRRLRGLKMKNNNKGKLIPELRFNEFEGEWREVKFSDNFKFLRTNSFSRNQLNYEGGNVLNIHYGDIHSKFNTLFVASSEKVPYINNNIDLSKFVEEDYLKEGDIVIADASEDYKDIGKCIEIINLGWNKTLSGLHTIPVRPKGSKSYGFLGNLMKTWSIRHEMMRNANGISVLGISKSNIGKLKLYLPTPKEQQKISSFLSLIDKKIELLNKKKELLELYKKGVMQKIFNREIRFKDNNGNDYPEWEEKRLGEIAKVNKGEQKNRSKLREEFEYPVINGGQEPSGFLDSYNTSKNTITISEGGNSCGFVNFITENFWSGGHCYTLEDLSENINQDYLYNYLKYSQKNIMRLRVGSGLPNIQKGDIQKFKILEPSFDEQLIIKGILNAADKLINLNNSFLQKIKIFKNGLLQKMFI